MAKWGEGDPRWIVEERPDAVNVNNWHWTEKDATNWSENKLKELLTGLKIESEVALVTIKEVEKIEGEASVNNRKAKLIYLFDWNITLKWVGRLKGGTEECEGKFSIPNLSDENDISEITVEVSLNKSSKEGHIVKEYLHHEGQEKVRETLGVYLKLLKEEFSRGVILPKKESGSVEVEANQNKNTNSVNTKLFKNDSVKSEPKSNKFDQLTTLTASYTFQCTAEDFYASMTDANMMQAFSRGPVQVDARPEGKFELFGGHISGYFVELVPQKRVVERWRLADWPAGHYSTVTLEIEQQASDTLVTLTQSAVPSSETDVLRGNWEKYYWDSLKRVFGWGSFL